MTDDELEAMFRDSLAGIAGEALPVADPVTKAHAGARRRRRVMVGLAAAAAVVVLAPAAVVAVTLNHGLTTTTVPPPSGWRVESYNGIELKVPPTWGWGGIPSVGCPGATSTHPYVGRPMQTAGGGRTCIATRADKHVWLDSPLPVGSSSARVTVLVHALTSFRITVADTDAEELQQILASIHSVTTDSNGCPTTAHGGPPGQAVGQPAPVLSLSVCLYLGPASHPNPGFLYYSTRVGRPASSRAVGLIEASHLPKHSGFDRCFDVPLEGLSRVTLVAHLDGAAYSYSIDPNACVGEGLYVGGVSPDVGGIGAHPLTRVSVRLWAIDGVPEYAAGGSALTPFLPQR